MTSEPSLAPHETGPIPTGTPGEKGHWGGVFAMSFAAFALVASEFMPVSLLTPMAADLGVSEGLVGQGIAISGLFAVLTSLSISTLAGRVNRKTLLLGLTVLMAVSGALISIPPGYAVFMVGRALIGVVIGGFWSMSAAMAIRLVPAAQVPRALAIFNGGNALATVLAAPLGSYLGALIGWRGAFFCLVPVAVIVLIWQWITLPSLAVTSRGARRPGHLRRLPRREEAHRRLGDGRLRRLLHGPVHPVHLRAPVPRDGHPPRRHDGLGRAARARRDRLRRHGADRPLPRGGPVPDPGRHPRTDGGRRRRPGRVRRLAAGRPRAPGRVGPARHLGPGRLVELGRPGHAAQRRAGRRAHGRRGADLHRPRAPRRAVCSSTRSATAAPS